MSTILNNLYPPLVQSIAPAYIYQASGNFSYKVYFSISSYNSINDIKNVQYTLVDTKSNKSILNSKVYPTGIKVTDFFEDTSIENDYRYYIVIHRQDLSTNFTLNNYYKIQMRFTANVKDVMKINNIQIKTSDVQPIATWLSEKLPYFSEWSKGCLIRCIATPTLTLSPFTSASVNISQYLSKITGKLTFNNAIETDSLKEYRFKFYLKSQTRFDGLIFDSGPLYPKETNTIDYSVPYVFDLNTSYIVTCSYTTKCLYSNEKSSEFKITQLSNYSYYTIKSNISSNDQEGYINLHIDMDSVNSQGKVDVTAQQYKGNIVIKRTSSKTNFKIWEEMYTIDHIFQTLDWQDITIESGIWYKYGIFFNLSMYNGTKWTNYFNTHITNPVICLIEDTFLIHNDLQLRLAFNFNISSFKYNTSESQQITLGSKFPYIKRNGKNFYRTFSINGLISSLMDNNFYIKNDPKIENSSLHMNQSLIENDQEIIQKHFTSKEKIYGDFYNQYIQEEQNRDISDYLNPFYEKMFRETIYDFLYDNNVKLFKSHTEGNILIKLIDVTFEPMASLGRMLYSFSATAIEVAEPTFENFLKYHIVSDRLLDLVTYSTATVDYVGINANKTISTRTGYYNNIMITINADGAAQNEDNIEKWILYTKEHYVEGGNTI